MEGREKGRKEKTIGSQCRNEEGRADLLALFGHLLEEGWLTEEEHAKAVWLSFEREGQWGAGQ